MNTGPTIEFRLHIAPVGARRGRGRHAGSPTLPGTSGDVGRVPRVARLLALAIRIDDLIRSGEVSDLTQAASLGHVTQARMSQIMDLLNLAPDIQAEILLGPATTRGRDRLTERSIRPVLRTPGWREQRRRWAELKEMRQLRSETHLPEEGSEPAPSLSRSEEVRED